MTDKLIRAIDAKNNFRLILCNSTNTVEEMRQIHFTSPTATAALGRVLTITAMLGSDLKNDIESLTIKVKGNGPAGLLLAVSNGKGELKGHMDFPQADVPSKSNTKLDVGTLVGKKGTLSIIRDYGIKDPYIGHSALVSGEIAEDFANYFYYSEQQPTVVSLGVFIEPDHTCSQAGGLIIQALPGYSEEALERMESCVNKLPPITALLKEEKDPRKILEDYFCDFAFEILEETSISYQCNCSKEKVEGVIVSLGKEEIREMIEEDHGAEVQCHFCNKKYSFSEGDLRNFIQE